MFNNKKITPYIFVFLAFCVISSKHIIIYNEEILVAISFLFFVLFVSFYFGDTIKESLDERKTSIQLEFENFLNLKKDCLNTLFKIHNKAFSSDKIISNLNKNTSLKMKLKFQGCEKNLRNVFKIEIKNKLKNLSNSNFNLKSKMLKVISDLLLTAVLVKNRRLNVKTTQNPNHLNFKYLNQTIKTFSK